MRQLSSSAPSILFALGLLHVEMVVESNGIQPPPHHTIFRATCIILSSTTGPPHHHVSLWSPLPPPPPRHSHHHYHHNFQIFWGPYDIKISFIGLHYEFLLVIYLDFTVMGIFVSFLKFHGYFCSKIFSMLHCCEHLGDSYMGIFAHLPFFLPCSIKRVHK